MTSSAEEAASSQHAILKAKIKNECPRTDDEIGTEVEIHAIHREVSLDGAEGKSLKTRNEAPFLLRGATGESCFTQT